MYYHTKSKTEVFKVANHQIFYASDFGLLSTSEMPRMRFALKSGDFRQNLGSLGIIILFRNPFVTVMTRLFFNENYRLPGSAGIVFVAEVSLNV